MLILNAKFLSQLFIASHAMGVAIIEDSATSFTISEDNMITISLTPAPITLRTAISFLRCSVVNMVSPNNPMQEIKMAKKEKLSDNLLTMVSLLYNFWYSSSAKKYRKGNFGSSCLNIFSILATASLVL